MRADSRVGGVAELRCCTAHVDVDVDVRIEDESRRVDKRRV